jgi:ureidoglycolate lyase
VTGRRILLRPPDTRAFAPYGRFILPPDRPGRRAFYSDSLQAHPPGSAPVLHVNHVPASELPLIVTGLERHPHAAQCFAPLDVARYAVLVMPSDASGAPQPSGALGFLVPGNVGVIYHPDVWHLGATVLDRPGHFTVLMWRGGAEPDDVFRPVEPLTLALPDPESAVDQLAHNEVSR